MGDDCRKRVNIALLEESTATSTVPGRGVAGRHPTGLRLVDFEL